MRTCSFDGCFRVHESTGLCKLHAAQNRRGRPLKAIRPSAMNFSDRFFGMVDKTDFCWNWTGSKSGTGYGNVRMDGKVTPAHRASYILAHGEIPDGKLLDHICHNTLCVNPAHLRAVSHKQNMENKRAAYSSSKSGVLGVNWHAKSRKWVASVSHNKRRMHVGYFADLEEAKRAVIAKRNELFTHNDADRVTK